MCMQLVTVMTFISQVILQGKMGAKTKMIE